MIVIIVTLVILVIVVMIMMNIMIIMINIMIIITTTIILILIITIILIRQHCELAQRRRHPTKLYRIIFIFRTPIQYDMLRRSLCTIMGNIKHSNCDIYAIMLNV